MSKSFEEILLEAISSNPNIFGEAIREYSFVKRDQYEFGCYSTFDLKPEFKPVDTSSDLGHKLLNLISDGYYGLAIKGYNPHGEEEYSMEEFQMDYPGVQLFSNGEIHLAWYWDGDGTLLVGARDKFAINLDCKKDYRWEWVK